ncbi:MAG: glycosyltransferase family 4 protein [Deltaproteobacteria bacterium]|nr:glycosyltransferase family 4 protein [Deltaproteobacteria bacterium]
MKPLRITLVTNGLGYGGAERIVLELARGLSAAGDQLSVVATTRGGPIEDELRACGISVSILGIRSALDGRIPILMARALDHFEAEIVHSHLAVSDIAVALAPKRIPRVSTVHNPGVELGGVRKRLWHLSLLRFQRVLAVGTVVRRALPRWLPVSIDRPSLVDREPLLRKEARLALGIEPDERVVLGVGRLLPVKGFDVLAEARPMMTTKARVMVIGDGPERGALEGRGLELLGSRGDAPALLAAADVLVCPSRSEGFPQVPIEAAWARVPVVGTRVGGLPEVVVDGETGLLVPAADPIALAAAIDRLVADRALATRLGEGARARVIREGLTAKAMVERMRVLYRELISLHGTR